MPITTDDECMTYLRITSAANIAKYGGLVTLLRPFAERMVRKYVGYGIEEATYTEYHPLISTRPSMSQGYTEDEEILAYEGSPQGARPIRQGRGNSRDCLRLCNLPVRSIGSIYEDPSAWINTDVSLAFPATTLLVAGRDYQVDWDKQKDDGTKISSTGFVYRTGGIWSLQARTVKVTYTAGYTAAELAATGHTIGADEAMDFKSAILITTAKLVKEAILNGVVPDQTGIILAESLDGYSVQYMAPLQGLDLSLMNDMPAAAKKILEERVRLSKYI
jgi:hypothetical protein